MSSSLLSLALLDFSDVIKCVTDSLHEMAKVIEEHREQWLCEGEGHYESPFIFNY